MGRPANKHRSKHAIALRGNLPQLAAAERVLLHLHHRHSRGARACAPRMTCNPAERIIGGFRGSSIRRRRDLRARRCGSRNSRRARNGSVRRSGSGARRAGHRMGKRNRTGVQVAVVPAVAPASVVVSVGCPRMVLVPPPTVAAAEACQREAR
jgi:hypothetical protein